MLTVRTNLDCSVGRPSKCFSVRGMEITTQERSSQSRGDEQKLLLAKTEIGLKGRSPSECSSVQLVTVSHRSTTPYWVVTGGAQGPRH